MKTAVLWSDLPAIRDGGIFKGPCFLCFQAAAFTRSEKTNQITCLSLLNLLFEVPCLTRMMAPGGIELHTQDPECGRTEGMVSFKYAQLLAD